MDLTAVLNLSTGALVMRRVGNRLVMFFQLPGMTKAKVIAGALTPDDCLKIREYLDVEGTDNTGWNRFEVQVITAADLTGT